MWDHREAACHAAKGIRSACPVQGVRTSLWHYGFYENVLALVLSCLHLQKVTVMPEAGGRTLRVSNCRGPKKHLSRCLCSMAVSAQGCSHGWPSLLPFISHGQAHQEGRHHRQVRHTLWCLAPKDREALRDPAARQVHVHLLWQGEREARSRWHLEVQVQDLSEDHCWRLLDADHRACRHCPCDHCTPQEAAGRRRGGVSVCRMFPTGAKQGVRKSLPHVHF